MWVKTLCAFALALACTLTPTAAGEEYHEIDPDPNNLRTGEWALVSAAVSELGPSWYFFVSGWEVFYEVVFEAR